MAANWESMPVLVCLDSQSVKRAPRLFAHRGTDGGKRTNGRKRRIVTDVDGCIFACFVPAASGHDGVCARRGLLPKRPTWGTRLLTVVTDKGYRGRFAEYLCTLEPTHPLGSRPPTAQGSGPVVKR